MMRRPLIAIVLVSVAHALAACTSGPAVFLQRPETPVGWPPAPQEARVSVDFAYHGSEDVDTQPGFFVRLFSFFVGDDHQELAAPGGSVLHDDELCMADTALQAVHRLSLATGEHTIVRGLAELRFGIPIAVARTPDGRLFVTDSERSRVAVIVGDEVTGTFGEDTLERPTGIAWDAAGQRLLVVDTTAHTVRAFDTEGRLLASFGERGTAAGQFNYPTHIAVGHDGTIVVSDSMNFRIQAFDQTLQPSLQIGQAGRGPGTFASPKGVALDPDGNLWVVDALFENVQIFDPTGQLLLVVGRSGSGFGELHLPTAIHIDPTGRVVLSDSGNARVQLLHYHRPHAPDPQHGDQP